MPELECIHEGTCYPTNHVSAVIDQRSQAEQAAEALRRAGFADVGLFHGHEAYAAIQEKSERKSTLERAKQWIRNIGDEDEIHAHYLAALQRGASYLIVYANTREEAYRAREILTAHQAYNLWYLGSWVMERLPESQPEMASFT
jgi:rhamnogalacturonyl hydrolase YesR